MKNAVMIVCLGAAAAATALLVTPPVRAQSIAAALPVTVANPPSNPALVKVVNTPVATTAQGTTTVAGTVQAQQSGNWSVNVTSLPLVNAAQSGPWSVALTGTPTVALSGGSVVSIDNSMAQPVFVRDVDAMAKQPFQTEVGCSQSGPVCNSYFDVPIGKLLQIEFADADISALQGTTLVEFWVVVLQQGRRVTHRLSLTPQGSESSSAPTFIHFAGTHTVQMYADAGTQVLVHASAYPPSDENFMTSAATISGHLVDCTTAPGCPVVASAAP